MKTIPSAVIMHRTTAAMPALWTVVKWLVTSTWSKPRSAVVLLYADWVPTALRGGHGKKMHGSEYFLMLGRLTARRCMVIWHGT
jgi:hypothetical protein